MALALGGASVGGPFSSAERELIRQAKAGPTPRFNVGQVRKEILGGEDPLGSALLSLRNIEERRSTGQFFTDTKTIRAMVDWITGHTPGRVVDVGCGSGRFAVEAARVLPRAEILAVDIDPVATLITRANLAVVAGPSSEAEIRVVNGDFLSMSLEPRSSVTAFIGNPPYVRHHKLPRDTKQRGQALAKSAGHPISGLAGLHAYFVLKIANLCQPGDVGCLITSSEWMDVGYGGTLRKLLASDLGLNSLHFRAIDGEGEFEDALTSAVVTCFANGSRKSTVSLHKVNSGEAFDLAHARRTTTRDCLRSLGKWGPLFEDSMLSHGGEDNTRPLGDVFRVSRGVATGHNRFFVMAPEQATWHSIQDWVTPVVSSATEIHSARGVLRRDSAQKVLLAIPRETRVSVAPELMAYLKVGEDMGVPQRYICTHRKPWWAVHPPDPAPIVATYMGRRPPVFAQNPDGLPLLNIALGLQPRSQLTGETIVTIVNWLNENAARFSGKGRTYQGGLQKFEPREMEALQIPARVLDGYS